MPAEVHIGDVGTLYRCRVLDDGVDFDPSDADVKQLIFRLPSGDVVIKDAVVLAVGSPAESWYLEYEIQAGDGIGSPAGDFHATHGELRIQAYLEWADGSRFHSDVRMSDSQGRLLWIYENLD